MTGATLCCFSRLKAKSHHWLRAARRSLRRRVIRENFFALVKAQLERGITNRQFAMRDSWQHGEGFGGAAREQSPCKRAAATASVPTPRGAIGASPTTMRPDHKS